MDVLILRRPAVYRCFFVIGVLGNINLFNCNSRTFLGLNLGYKSLDTGYQNVFFLIKIESEEYMLVLKISSPKV